MARGWFTVLGGAEILAGGAMTVWPDLPSWLGYAVMVAGAGTIGWGFREVLRDRAGRYILPRFRLDWGAPSETSSERFPVSKILDMARAKGWVFDDKSLHILDLADALRQGGVDGSISFWGRAWNGRLAQSVRREPLVAIPADHWRDYSVDAISLGHGDDNFDVSSYISSNHTKGYADLHIGDSKRVDAWLKNAAVHYRGKRKP